MTPNPDATFHLNIDDFRGLLRQFPWKMKPSFQNKVDPPNVFKPAMEEIIDFEASVVVNQSNIKKPNSFRTNIKI